MKNKNDKKGGKIELVHLIDEKRAYSCDIALARFKMSFEQIRDAIFDMDTQVLTTERLVPYIPLLIYTYTYTYIHVLFIYQRPPVILATFYDDSMTGDRDTL